MEIEFSPKAIKDLEFWRKSGNKNIQVKIEAILTSILDTPFNGLGKPEPLKHELKGKWSRRITKEHRIIYSISQYGDVQILSIISLKGHY